MYVYKITNIINQKVYIGITSRTIEERFKEHKNRINERIHLHLYSSMKKHGVENFKVELLESCDTLESLFTQERF
jgi:group I intron endonuclease